LHRAYLRHSTAPGPHLHILRRAALRAGGGARPPLSAASRHDGLAAASAVRRPPLHMPRCATALHA
jgi:hypothetical protein